jgi:hypothetical protein
MYIPIKVENIETNAIIDTASQLTVMNAELYNKLKPQPKLTEHIELKDAGKESLFAGRKTEKVVLKIGNFIQKQDIVVCDISYDLLLGLDFLENHDTVIDLKSYTVSLDNREIPIKQITDMELKKVNIYKVLVQKGIAIPSNTMKFVKLKANILAIQPQSIHNELHCTNCECLAYRDHDVIFIGTGFNSHIQNLQTVRSRFEKYNLKLKPNKFQTEIKFLEKIVP